MEQIRYLFVILNLFLVVGTTFASSMPEIVGKFKIPHLSNDLTLLNVVEKKNRLLLVIKPSESSNECAFQIRELASPQQTRGREGRVTVFAKSCNYLIKNTELKKFWDSILSVTLFYSFRGDKWQGRARLNSLEETYSYPLDSFEVK